MNGRRPGLLLGLVLVGLPCGCTEAETVPAGTPSKEAPLILGKVPVACIRSLSGLTDGNRTLVRFDEGVGDGLAYLREVDLADGTIEFEVRERNVMQRSFVGIAFHGADSQTCDAVYFRPFNFQVEPA